ncbi:FHA domain-containing protein [Entamoeba marina]
MKKLMKLKKKEEKEKENVITKEQTTVDKVEKENIEGNNEEQTNEKKVEENKMEEIKEKKEENNDKKMEEIKENKEEHKMEEEKKEEKKMEEENKVEKKMEEENKVEEIKEKIEENNKKQMEEIKEEEHKMEEVDIINEVKKEKEGEDKKETENKEKLDEVLLGQYKYCRFCEGEPYETSVSYLPIINERVGNFPIVLKSKPKCRSNYICLHHWRENRREYLEHYVQNERSVIDESLVLLYASMIDKKINYSYTPSTNNIQEDTKASFSKYLALRKQQMEMAMGAIPAGLAVTSDLLCNACNSPTQQMFDLSLFPPSFVQFLAWQRLMQIYSKLDSSNIELLNAMKKEALKESDKVVKESVKLTNDNPSEARKRLQPDYVEKPNQKKNVKSDILPPAVSLPPIGSSTTTSTQLPPISVKQPRTKSYPYFVNEQNKKTLYTFTQPKIIIGRKGKDNTVDFDLSQYMDAKSVSHLHAIVEYEKEQGKWLISVKGRNGMKVDAVSKGKDSTEFLKNGSILEVSNFQFSFHCPEDFNGQF